MSDSDADKSEGRRLIDTLRDINRDADKGREPAFLPARDGRRQVSISALVERIIDQFIAEHGERESDAVQRAVTTTERIKLVKAVAEYVIALESIQVSDAQKARIIRRVYAEMFAYGALDDLINDPQITTITIEGADKVAIRRGHGELKPAQPLFDDEAHLKRIIRRLLEDAGASLRPDVPMIETGLMIDGRRVSLNAVLPPATVLISADLRLHPPEPPTLDALAEDWAMPPAALDLLRRIAASSHGVVIVGEAESGKTTLTGALLSHVGGRVMSVERAGELALPPEASRLLVRWPVGDVDGRGFDQLVAEALSAAPDVLVLDEVRADEAQAIAPLLTAEETPRQIWSFRGGVDHKRLAASLGMLARRAAPSAGESAVRALYRRLPFVVTVRRRHERLMLHSIAEWQFPPSAEYPDFVALMAMGADGITATGNQPSRAL
ncbi:MAG: hypothetical protein EA396_14550 [Anaerolineaceae bacterium]|nr:MAG: hypothetical protein EA396_14550 [Anaerolineaceae bacterium]